MTREELHHLLEHGIITQAEHDVLELADHMSERGIALTLKISRAAVRDRRDNAHRKINLHRQETNADLQPRRQAR